MASYQDDPVVYRRAYYLRNRVDILARVQEYRQENLKSIAEYRAKCGKRIAARTMVRNAKNRAEKSGLPFDCAYVTVARVQNALMRDSKCRACRERFDFAHTGKMGPHSRSATLDRVVNELGYVEGNVSILCWPCNKAKGTLTLSQLRLLVVWMEKKCQQNSR